MIKILMSSFNHYHLDNDEKVANAADNSNGIIDHIKNNIKDNNTIVFFASQTSNKEKTNNYAKLLFDSLKLSGISFNEYIVVDSIDENIKDYIKRASMIFLCGGSTYEQNEFFKKINLKELLKDYDGLLMGQSAGELNMSEDVFNSPEEIDNPEPVYFKGLGLTDLNVEPHFVYDTSNFNELELNQRKAILDESNRRTIYGQCDGSHVLIDNDDNATIYGETYIIENGIVSLICENKQSKKIESNVLKRSI